MLPGSAQHPQTPAQPYGYVPQKGTGSVWSISAMVVGSVALVFCPLVLGLFALWLSGKAKAKGESLAGAARIVSLIGLIGGIILGVLINVAL